MYEEIQRLEAEVAGRQAKIAQLRARAAHQMAEDLEAFEQLSDAEQAMVHRHAPDRYMKFMEAKREQAEHALMERQSVPTRSEAVAR